ncbi:MAG: hypothetical protein SVS85_02185 [Candidatus Nanohaloarchaea archaeon]|nr:hypothetical protein [Candidatus Nanohaloarchaea archaeon]
MEDSFVLQRIDDIETEVKELKEDLSSPGKAVQLKGLWKGAEVDEEDFEEAEKSLFEGAG